MRTRQIRKIRVGRCTLGQGVFANRAFAPGEIVGQVLGEIIDDPDYASTYGMDLGGNLTLDPRPPFRYLNHSCRPNCQLFVCEIDACHPLPRMWVEVIAPIRAGEELTIDYGWPADWAIPCGCTAPDCRGWIVDETQLYKLPQRPGWLTS